MLRIVSAETRLNTYMITVTLSDGRTTDVDASPRLLGPSVRATETVIALYSTRSKSPRTAMR
ncbi:MAG: hypothetical protein WC054_11670 [Candidatus Nanopelagicales bacterium]